MPIETIKRQIFQRNVPAQYPVLTKTCPFVPFAEINKMLDPDESGQFSSFLPSHLCNDQVNLSAVINAITLGFTESTIEAFFPENLSPFGKIVKETVRGRTFVDMGCGNPEVCTFPRFMAEVFRAERYIGVDLHEIHDHVRKNEFLVHERFISYFIRDDMLVFLSKLKLERPLFFLSAMEPLIANENAERYIDLCLDEMAGITQSDDPLIIGIACKGFHPERHQFKKIAENRDNPLDFPDPLQYLQSSVYVRI